MKNRKIQILFVVILAFGFLGMLFYWSQGEQKQAGDLKDLNETYSKYDRKIRDIRDSIAKKRNEAENIERPAAVILAFSEQDMQLMEEIFPNFERRDMQATLVLKNSAEHNWENVEYLKEQGWDIAFGGEIGENGEQYIEDLKAAADYEENTGKAVRAYFFNGKEYGTGSRLLYPEFQDMSFEISVAFSKNEDTLNHGINREYGKEIEECQNISLREDFEIIKKIIEQVIEKKSVAVLSDFGMENQLEIAEEAPLEHLEEILDFIKEKQEEQRLVTGSVSQYLGALENREKLSEERQEEYLEYEEQCQEEIEELIKERDAFLKE